MHIESIGFTITMHDKEDTGLTITLHIGDIWRLWCKANLAESTAKVARHLCIEDWVEA